MPVYKSQVASEDDHVVRLTPEDVARCFGPYDSLTPKRVRKLLAKRLKEPRLKDQRQRIQRHLKELVDKGVLRRENGKYSLKSTSTEEHSLLNLLIQGMEGVELEAILKQPAVRGIKPDAMERALERLTLRGLVEESQGKFRLTPKGTTERGVCFVCRKEVEDGDVVFGYMMDGKGVIHRACIKKHNIDQASLMGSWLGSGDETDYCDWCGLPLGFDEFTALAAAGEPKENEMRLLYSAYWQLAGPVGVAYSVLPALWAVRRGPKAGVPEDLREYVEPEKRPGEPRLEVVEADEEEPMIPLSHAHVVREDGRNYHPVCAELKLKKRGETR